MGAGATMGFRVKGKQLPAVLHDFTQSCGQVAYTASGKNDQITALGGCSFLSFDVRGKKNHIPDMTQTHCI